MSAIRLTKTPRCFQCAGQDVERELAGLVIRFASDVTVKDTYVLSREEFAKWLDGEHCHNAAEFARKFLFGTVVYIEIDSCEVVV